MRPLTVNPVAPRSVAVCVSTSGTGSAVAEPEAHVMQIKTAAITVAVHQPECEDRWIIKTPPRPAPDYHVQTTGKSNLCPLDTAIGKALPRTFLPQPSLDAHYNGAVI